MKTITRLGPEWIAAIALTLQAFVFLVQAGFLWWQARILKRHALTLEEHTGIARTQAETARLIGQALNQQGKVLDEQTKIMAKQFELQRRVESKTERDSLLTSAVDMLAAFRELNNRLTRIQLSTFTQKDNDEVIPYFDRLNTKAVSCSKALWTAVHISEEERDYFFNYSKKLSNLGYKGDIRKALQEVNAIEAETEGPIFLTKLGNLAKTPETS